MNTFLITSRVVGGVLGADEQQTSGFVKVNRNDVSSPLGFILRQKQTRDKAYCGSTILQKQTSPHETAVDLFFKFLFLVDNRYPTCAAQKFRLVDDLVRLLQRYSYSPWRAWIHRD